jgi:hypothetical protein
MNGESRPVAGLQMLAWLGDLVIVHWRDNPYFGRLGLNLFRKLRDAIMDENSIGPIPSFVRTEGNPLMSGTRLSQMLLEVK